ncbi:MAG: 3-isopropylmalate dehydratase small subunit [Desulfobacula sp.]|jgi:3-isopropylmalate/(R)-2-methylmalate dehydratase small subunit|uniref:3-isopropylmalate dehydratase small subunit n=1 Tax=Desulfobacula sp. TaxID=2593537 RepID=UPI001DA79CE8|nr:3-isopropylmalate dehydratase small subunit [Desulfobacula sp.]MBT3484009.1 3-isopropylmalate dehydratase small subunit [Desulfobacula sp.]MBT3805951.1 3-isopropylmalate dehydratase small subunit [Desulfobacula sp.]MBT4026364.1 3-isopropylmalate dehydratase small subunit [Desulfobacula sp.]MBT4198091.1 3-isopropylmalate dehydratase small subunit [Desulfobacula sp.]
MKEFKGNILFLDRSDINTDEIIPAKYLTEIEKTALKQHLFEDLKLDGFNPEMDIKEKAVIVTKENFGCGSSREHAPWALEVNHINVVIAQSFARIFRQNMFNCGMLAIELSEDKINHIFKEFGKSDTKISVDMEAFEIMVQSKDQTKTIKFQISEFDKALIKTGGWVEYADTHY